MEGLRNIAKRAIFILDLMYTHKKKKKKAASGCGAAGEGK